jgi:hypothetical protein
MAADDARALAIGRAWLEARALMPKEWGGPNLFEHQDYTGARSWIADAGYAPSGHRAWGDTPEQALAELTRMLQGGVAP